MSSTLIRLVVVAARPNWSFWISAAVVCTPRSRLSYPNEHDGSLLDASTHFATTSFQSRAHCSLADPSWEWSKWEQERKNWKLWDEKIGFFSSLTRTKLSRIDDEEMKRHTKWPKQEAWNHLSLLLTRRLTRAANPRWMNEASELIRFFLGNLLLFVGNFFLRTFYDKCCICWRWFVHSHPIISVSSSLVLVGLSAAFPTPLMHIFRKSLSTDMNIN